MSRVLMKSLIIFLLQSIIGYVNIIIIIYMLFIIFFKGGYYGSKICK